MKIGILKTDNVRPGLAERFGEYPDMFGRLFKNVESDIELITFDILKKEYPKNIDEVDAYLITGSSASVYEDLDWIKELSGFIKELDAQKKKTLGICFGHQLIAHVLGGKTEKSETGWHIGTQPHNLLQPGIDLLGESENFNLIFSHQDQVVIPAKGSITLATTSACPIAMCKIGAHILTVQAHPEFENEYARELITLRKDLFGEDLFQAGVNSLERENDRGLVAQWLIDFIEESER